MMRGAGALAMADVTPGATGAKENENAGGVDGIPGIQSGQVEPKLLNV